MTGKTGEDIATALLISKGFEILANNYKKFCGEIDIIAKKENLVAFVEVKYRKDLSMGYPREAVDLKKQNRVRDAAAFFISEKSLEIPTFSEYDFRFDVIEIIGSIMEISHIENAF